MGGISTGAGLAIAGGVGAAGSLAGGLIGASGQKQAAQTNEQAMQQEQAMAQPFVNMGQTAGNELTSELQTGELGQPAPTNLAAISQMPGYKFTLQQGLLSTQNAAAARGLGVSGAALMGAANYSTGLAQSNFQNYFSDYWANQMNRYNMLAGLTGVGANAAVGAGSNIGQTAASIGNAQAGAGTATAAGVSGVSNSLSNALVANALLQNQGSTINTPYAAPGLGPNPSGSLDMTAGQGYVQGY